MLIVEVNCTIKVFSGYAGSMVYCQHIVCGRELEWVNTMLTFGETLFAWNFVDMFIMHWISIGCHNLSLIVATVNIAYRGVNWHSVCC